MQGGGDSFGLADRPYIPVHLQGKTPSQVKDHVVLCAGAGSAGMGIMKAVQAGMVSLSGQGISLEAAADRIFVCDVDGLVAMDGCSAEKWASYSPEQKVHPLCSKPNS